MKAVQNRATRQVVKKFISRHERGRDTRHLSKNKHKQTNKTNTTMKKETKGVMLTILSVLLCIGTAGRVEASGLDAICVSVLIASLIFGISGKILIGDEH